MDHKKDSRPLVSSLSMRPVREKDMRELCLMTEHGMIVVTIGLSQLAYLGEQCNRIVYAKLAGKKGEG